MTLVIAAVLALVPPLSAKATFAGGCYWCVEEAFRGVSGVVAVRSGFTGGSVQDPTYRQVSTGTTGHAESVEVVFDPSKVSYERLLDVFWENIDPLQANGQFCDRGSQYRTAIFFHDDAQKRAAEASKQRVEERLQAKVATEIVRASIFYPVDREQQDYARRHPDEYARYRKGCGRDELLKQIWGATPLEERKPPS